MPGPYLAYTSQYDFYPRASGKGNAVAYLQRRYGLAPAQCVALFDDDNDLPMARRCEGGQLLPGLTSKSVARAALEHPEWRVAERAGQGVFAIEELLEALLERRAARAPAGALGTPGEAAAAEGSRCRARRDVAPAHTSWRGPAEGRSDAGAHILTIGVLLRKYLLESLYLGRAVS